MKPWKALAVLTLGSAIAATAYAQAPQRGEGSPAAQDRTEHDRHPARAMHRGMVDPAERLAKLKTELKLTPAQEAPFNAYASVVQKQAEQRRAMREKMRQNREELAKLPAPERMARFNELMKLRLAAMEERTAALRDFYNVLDPQQKATVDKRFMPRRMHG